MAVWPLGSSSIGSTSTRAVEVSSTEGSTTSMDCCRGGWNFMAKSTPPRWVIAKWAADLWVSSVVMRARMASREGSLSSTARMCAVCPSTHLRTSGSSLFSSHWYGSSTFVPW